MSNKKIIFPTAHRWAFFRQPSGIHISSDGFSIDTQPPLSYIAEIHEDKSRKYGLPSAADIEKLNLLVDDFLLERYETGS